MSMHVQFGLKWFRCCSLPYRGNIYSLNVSDAAVSLPAAVNYLYWMAQEE